MKILIQLVLTALLAWLLQGLFHLPWWSVAIAGMAASVPQKTTPGQSFLAGFLGVFILWSTVAFLADSANESLLSAQVGQLFPSSPSSFALVLVTGGIGGFVAGLSALTATFLNTTFRKPKQ